MRYDTARATWKPKALGALIAPDLAKLANAIEALEPIVDDLGHESPAARELLDELWRNYWSLAELELLLWNSEDAPSVMELTTDTSSHPERKARAEGGSRWTRLLEALRLSPRPTDPATARDTPTT